jgi:hypothetical protein
MRQPRPSTAVRRRSSESGSAYIIALLALVVLSILGLGLALITQTEMQVGAGEMTYQRMLYSADSGTARATANAFAHYDCAAIPGASYQIADQDLSGLMTNSGLRQEVAVTASIMVISPPCPLCKVNNATGSQEAGQQDYYEIHHVLSAEAERRKGTSPTSPALGKRTVGTFFSLQPWPINPDCQKIVGTGEAGKVKL